MILELCSIMIDYNYNRSTTIVVERYYRYDRYRSRLNRTDSII